MQSEHNLKILAGPVGWVVGVAALALAIGVEVKEAMSRG